MAPFCRKASATTFENEKKWRFCYIVKGSVLYGGDHVLIVLIDGLDGDVAGAYLPVKGILTP